MSTRWHYFAGCVATVVITGLACGLLVDYPLSLWLSMGVGGVVGLGWATLASRAER